MFQVRLHFGNRQQRFAAAIEHDVGNIMIEQHPLARAVRAAGEKNFEGIVSLNADTATATVTEQKFHLRRQLRMRRAAKTEAMREQTGPIVARAQISLRESRAPQILCALLAMRVMRVAPEPRR